MTPEEQKLFEEDLNQVLFKDKKIFLDGTKLYFTKEYFALRLTTGDQQETFAMTPYLAKMIMRTLVNQVKNYEDSFGEIVVDLPRPNVPSPLQMNDFQNPDSIDSTDQKLPDDSDKSKKKPKK